MGDPAHVHRATGGGASNRIAPPHRLRPRATRRGHRLIVRAGGAPLRGPAIDDIAPKLWGRVGLNNFELKRYGEARAAFVFARDRCLSIGDAVGVRTYRENIRVLAGLPIAADAASMAKEEALLRQLERAQRLSDLGQYQRSNDCLVTCEDDAGALAGYYRGKILGLRGFNLLKIGRRAEARQSIGDAVEACAQVGDEDGMRTFRENAAYIDALP